MHSTGGYSDYIERSSVAARIARFFRQRILLFVFPSIPILHIFFCVAFLSPFYPITFCSVSSSLFLFSSSINSSPTHCSPLFFQPSLHPLDAPTTKPVARRCRQNKNWQKKREEKKIAYVEPTADIHEVYPTKLFLSRCNSQIRNTPGTKKQLFFHLFPRGVKRICYNFQSGEKNYFSFVKLKIQRKKRNISSIEKNFS